MFEGSGPVEKQGLEGSELLFAVNRLDFLMFRGGRVGSSRAGWQERVGLRWHVNRKKGRMEVVLGSCVAHYNKGTLFPTIRF